MTIRREGQRCGHVRQYLAAGIVLACADPACPETTPIPGKYYAAKVEFSPEHGETRFYERRDSDGAVAWHLAKVERYVPRVKSWSSTLETLCWIMKQP